MSLSLISQLQAEIAEAQAEALKYQNAAHINHEKYLEEVAARQAESLDGIAAHYLTTGDELRVLLHGFGVLSLLGYSLDDMVQALVADAAEYPNRCQAIKTAFGVR